MEELETLVEKTLDCTGLVCPMPIIKAKQEIETVPSGKILKIIADDPGFEPDVKAWCKASGLELLKLEKQDNRFVAWVRKP